MIKLLQLYLQLYETVHFRGYVPFCYLIFQALLESSCFSVRWGKSKCAALLWL